MRRLGMMAIAGSLLWPVSAFAQTRPPQITNDDLLRMIGFQQVQNLQCGKALETAQQEIVKLAEKKDQKQEKKK